jgi:hypothetical protein
MVPFDFRSRYAHEFHGRKSSPDGLAFSEKVFLGTQDNVGMTLFGGYIALSDGLVKNFAAPYGPYQNEGSARLVFSDFAIPGVACGNIGCFGGKVRAQVAAKRTILINKTPGLLVGEFKGWF